MSIFINASPPSERKERVKQTGSIKNPMKKTERGCMSLPPIHIIPSTRGEGISKERIISLKYQNKEHMKGRRGFKKKKKKREIVTKEDKKYRRERM